MLFFFLVFSYVSLIFIIFFGSTKPVIFIILFFLFFLFFYQPVKSWPVVLPGLMDIHHPQGENGG